MIFAISNFSKGPHWDIAYIEADDEDMAKDILQDILDHSYDLDTDIWNQKPQFEWELLVARSPFTFVLGAGCRG